MPPTPFPAGKKLRELEIAPHRKLIVIAPDEESIADGLNAGDIGIIEHCSNDSDIVPFRILGGVKIHYVLLSELAYYEPTEPEVWEPEVGDRVTLEGGIGGIAFDGSVTVCLEDRILYGVPSRNLKFISRPTPPRRVTRKEAEAALGGAFEIIPD